MEEEAANDISVDAIRLAQKMYIISCGWNAFDYIDYEVWAGVTNVTRSNLYLFSILLPVDELNRIIELDTLVA